MDDIIQLKGTAYPKDEYFYKKTHPSQWETLQDIKKLVEHITAGKVAVKFIYPEAQIQIVNPPAK